MVQVRRVVELFGNERFGEPVNCYASGSSEPVNSSTSASKEPVAKDESADAYSKATPIRKVEGQLKSI